MLCHVREDEVGGDGRYLEEPGLAELPLDVVLLRVEIVLRGDLAGCAKTGEPAFERRIRTHVLFEMPGPVERERIWHVQIHPTRTPLAPDVDFKALAESTREYLKSVPPKSLNEIVIRFSPGMIETDSRASITKSQSSQQRRALPF